MLVYTNKNNRAIAQLCSLHRNDMKVYSTSYFKDPLTDHQFIKQWVIKLEQLNNRKYKYNECATSLGKTIVWSIKSEIIDKPALFIFPGFRTSSLFWDLDDNLQIIINNYDIYLVETNGQPTLSDGNTPDIKTQDYGNWAAEVIVQLTNKKVNIAGASFGALVCLKLSVTAPHLVGNMFLLNPGCLQSFSLSLKNLYYNLLPIIKPSEKNVRSFLANAVLYPPVHNLTAERLQLLIDYEVFALKRYVDKSQKPYAMSRQELEDVKAPVYLIVGEKDLLFPYKASVKAAQNALKNLKSVNVLQNTGHGIETYKESMNIIYKTLNQLT